MQVGRMEINSIASLTRLAASKSSKSNDGPTLADIDCESDEKDNQGTYASEYDFMLKISLTYAGIFAKFQVCPS